MIYGYERVSSKGQAKYGNRLEPQDKALKKLSAIEIYADAFTGTKTDSPEFAKLMMAILSLLLIKQKGMVANEKG